MSWNPNNILDNHELATLAASMREQLEAIATGTDPELLIVNGKISPVANITDTKLAQIVTAGKVSGSSITNLAQIPSGAGALPLTNTPAIPGSKLSDMTSIPAGAGQIPSANMAADTVKTAGNQTIEGIKTFGSVPVLPATDPASDNQAVRKKYVDDRVGNYAKYSYTIADNALGTTITTGDWRTVPLNTEDNDDNSLGELSSNQIILEAGTYKCHSTISITGTNITQCRLRDVDNTLSKIIGMKTEGVAAESNFGGTFLSGEFTIAVQTTLELQVRSNSGGRYGVHSAVTFGEVAPLAMIEFERIG